MAVQRTDDYYRVHEERMEDNFRRIDALTTKHEVEIQVLKQGQTIYADQMSKLINIQESQRDTLGHMRTSMSNAAWLLVVGVPLFTFFVQMLLKSFKG